MVRSLRYFVCVIVAAMAVTGVAVAAPVRTAHVEAELVPAATALTPGTSLTVALRLKMDKGWHTYWQNPGESGLPTTLAWKLPAGLTAGPIQWPPPRALPVGPLINYGYEGEVLLLTDIAATSALSSAAPATLRARADWLVCKEICIPEGADLALTLPVSPQSSSDPQWGDAIARARASVPRPLAGWTVAASGQGSRVEVALTPGADRGDPGEIRFFPFAEGKIEPSAPQTLVREGATLRLTLPVASQRVGDFTRVAGVLIASKGFGAQSAASIDVPLAGSIVAGPRPNAATAPFASDGGTDISLGVALAFALAGGLLLNLMPCVFPVLSLKVLGFAAHRANSRAMRVHGLAFAAGVIGSFWLRAGLLLALRAAGAQLGWGFQLQSPAVVVGLAVLFFVLALNLSGVFEIGQFLPSSLSTWNARNTYVNDALSGVLAVVVASPCSAPFMGAAIGYALMQSAPFTVAVFTALGFGMALPYLLLAFFPGWRNKLPAPGPWMLRLKEVLAFPLYATVIWLAWVLGAELDNDAVARLALMLLLIALSLWAWQTMRNGGARAWGSVALAGLVAAIVAGAPVVGAAVTGSEPVVKPLAADKGPWQDYAPERVRQLTDAGRVVFVDFTAAWCVTCQVNKRLVLNTEAVQQAFAQNNVALVRADWTRRDATIGRALAALGRSGVPVYVLYRPGREPLILPEVLQKRTIIDALANP
ncbi:MAG: thioredoxin family protein [Pseudomonadota bacterium]|nr:thioredoxin family protein [Pseudomonadota bacterium]